MMMFGFSTAKITCNIVVSLYREAFIRCENNMEMNNESNKVSTEGNKEEFGETIIKH